MYACTVYVYIYTYRAVDKKPCIIHMALSRYTHSITFRWYNKMALIRVIIYGILQNVLHALRTMHMHVYE